LDVWFDSGVSSWAALNYMNNKESFKKYWPANLNIEGKDQVRGWWNAQLILSEIKFGKKPFESISVHGMVLDIGKKKMSKSEGNIVSPSEIIEKYSRDFLRYYYAKISKGEDFSFQEREFSDIRKVFMTISNLAKFVIQIENGKEKICIEDEWIISRLNSTIKKVTEFYNQFKFSEAISELEQFLVEDFSRTYIQIIRERSDETKNVLDKVLIEILKLFAPIIPFMTEKIWQELKGMEKVKEESIHLSQINFEKKINEELESQFVLLRQVIERGLAERDVSKIGLRWPLSKITVYTKTNFHLEQFEEILKTQLNVKNVKFDRAKETELEIKLDTKLTPELEREGFARELSRKIQSSRKEAGLNKEDKIELLISVEAGEFLEILSSKEADFIKEKVGAKNILKSEFGKEKNVKNYKFNSEGKIKEKAFKIFFNKI